jgi:molecular chaperone DnaJ
MWKEYYSILWVEKTATQDEIKKAYRKKAMEHHPDRGWDAEIFKEINEAYSVLGDENKKREYDTYGRVWGGSPFWGAWWFGWAWFDVDLWDIFESFFWGWWRTNSRKKSNNFRWEDIEITFKIDLKTSIVWWKQKLKYEKMSSCPECNWEWWEWKKSCPDCKWTWYVKYRQQSFFGTIEHTWPCETCNWSWEIIEKVCGTCNWNKRIRKNFEYEIEIPAWIDNNMVIKIEWEWNDGIKWQAWDLYVKFRVEQTEKNLKRDWVNLNYDLEIDLIEAILWTTKEINIPIIWKRTVKIEAWTDFWTILKMPWDWVKYIDRDRKWDLFINIIIKIPKKLSETERECFEKLASEKKLNVHNKKWILEKIFW